MHVFHPFSPLLVVNAPSISKQWLHIFDTCTVPVAGDAGILSSLDLEFAECVSHQLLHCRLQTTCKIFRRAPGNPFGVQNIWQLRPATCPCLKITSQASTRVDTHTHTHCQEFDKGMLLHVTTCYIMLHHHIITINNRSKCVSSALLCWLLAMFPCAAMLGLLRC